MGIARGGEREAGPMAEDEQDGHRYLDLRTTDYSDRTFLGGMRLAGRTGLFFLVCLVAAVGFAATHAIWRWHVISAWQASRARRRARRRALW